jgi:uncharacterized membrane protein
LSCRKEFDRLPGVIETAFPGRTTATTPRRAYLDWLRGVAVLLMIEVHLVDSWTAPADRDAPIFGYTVIVGGMGTALFLMVAGVKDRVADSLRMTYSGRGAETIADGRRITS